MLRSRRLTLKWIILAFLLQSFFVIPLCSAQSSLQLKRKNVALSKLNAKIKSLQNDLTQVRNQRQDVQSQLKHTDITIGQLANQLQKSKQSFKAIQKQLRSLRRRDKILQTQLNEQQQLLAKQMRTAYQMGQHENLKLLLNQEDPELLNRLQHYHLFIKKARDKVISKLNNTMKNIIVSKQKILQNTEQLHHLLTIQQQQHNQLTHENAKRQHLIRTLDSTIASRKDRLKQMIENKHNLQGLIEKLRLAKVKKSHLRFSKQRHHLSLPIHGHIQTRYGAFIQHTNLKSNGVFIRSKQNKKVKAIFDGRVIFADWLRGYGLLIIIDHGDGYMSLYGHNNSLYSKTGEFVSAGTMIARTGHSGGQKQNGLYFEIRHNGKPQNPMRWCHVA